MSPYMNPHMNLELVMAQARSVRAQAISDAVIDGAGLLAGKIGSLFARLKAAQKQRAAVAQLMAMDERMLQDIGLNRSLVPFAMGNTVTNKAVDLYADGEIGVNANDNSHRQAA